MEKPRTRDNVYYLESVFFEVEDTIFQVPRYAFSKNEVFSTTFTLPPGDGVDAEGSSEATPFRLLGISVTDFRAFLQALYPLDLQTHASMTPEQWTSVLALSDMWSFASVRKYAIDKLEATLKDMDPVDKILLGEKYSMPAWFVEGCQDFIKRRHGPQLHEIDKLGQKAVHLYELRELKLTGNLYHPAAKIQEIFGEVAGPPVRFQFL